MKTTTADMWFSRCVRERANWTCENCGKQYDDKSMGLHCSHFIGRGNWAVRFDPLNADSHCYYCHSQFEGNPHKHTEWKKSRLKEVYEILIEKSNNLMLGKQNRRDVKHIAAHYRSEFMKMKEQRAEGKTGRLEFVGWT